MLSTTRSSPVTAPPSVEKTGLSGGWRCWLRLARSLRRPGARSGAETSSWSAASSKTLCPFFSRAGLVGQLLCMKKATHNNGFTVASWLPVLRVVEARRQGGAGAGSSEAQLHKVKLVCIGRARLHHSSGLATAEAGHAFNAAPLAEYADAPLQRDELDTAYRYVHAHTHTLLPALVPMQVHRPTSLGTC